MLNERDYSILDAIELPLAILAAWVMVKYTTRLLEMRLRRSGAVDAGMRDAITLLGRCLLAFGAALLISRAWGVDMGSLTIAASVIGVGIGFGLQNITSNFVSGLLVSLERPIRPGDFVKVGDLTGSVRRIGLRCTEVSTLDRVSILVPNSRFLEREVINWSHGDPVYRLRVPVPVAYSSDVSTVRAALLEAASSHRAVLRDPSPRVQFRAFGSSGLEFELHVWARDPKQQNALMSDMNYRVEASLRAHRIEIASSQLDVRIWERAGSSMAPSPAPAPPRRDSSGDETLNGTRASGSALTGSFDEVHDTRAWSDAETEALLARMRGTGGVPIADRRFRLRVYRRCFVASEAVDWLVGALGVSREEAVELGRALVARGSVHHVRHEHTFKDGHFFYRFRADEEEATPIGSRVVSCDAAAP
jgi:small-conductance mechanosensitive channel